MTIDQFTEKKSGETLNRLLEKRYNLKSVSKNDKNAAKEYFRKSLVLTKDPSVKDNINQLLNNL